MNTWFLSSGDFPFFWSEQIRSFSWLPSVWRQDMGFGLGQLMILWFEYPFRLMVKILTFMGLSWWEIEKMLWLAVVGIGIYASYALGNYVLKTRLFGAVSSIIYACNTYFILLVSGRQLGVALAYAISPLIFMKYMQTVDHANTNDTRLVEYLKRIIRNGVLLAILISFDLRISYLVMTAIVLYVVITRKFWDSVRIIFKQIIPSLFAGCSLHMFWILPLVLVRGGTVVSDDFTNPGMLRFLSVADFSHALSLLHPNWPENLFGKVYFLQPEFLIVPILAFGSLVFFGKKRRSHVLFFSLLAFLGAFLAKGTREPFGFLYEWLFIYIPGFVMFRDPTKWYLLTAMSYAVLIPFAISGFASRIKEMKQIPRRFLSAVHYACIGVFLVFWMISLRAMFFNPDTANVRLRHLDPDYVKLHALLISDKNPSRTLWIPEKDNFAYFSDLHPVLSGNTLFANASHAAMLSIINTSFFQETLAKAGVKYVIVPQDLDKHFFLTDYVWNPTLRTNLVDALGQSGLKKVEGYSRIDVFENSSFVFSQTMPPYVQEQQRLATIGLSVSICIGLLYGLILII